MSEVTEERMDNLEITLHEIKTQVTEISHALISDDKYGHVGIIDRIGRLETDVHNMKGVSNKQEVSISTRKAVTDDWILLAQRIFWAAAVLLGIGLILTGKLGFADLFK